MSGHIEDRWLKDGKRTGRYGNGRRYRARWVDPDGRERSKSFDRKADAENCLTEVKGEMLKGIYLDPDAGRITVAKRLPHWLATRTCDPTSKSHIEGRVNRHLLPGLGGKRLDQLARAPSLVQAWAASLPVEPSYAKLLLGDLASLLDQAVTDGLIARNPCRMVKLPKTPRRKVVPWTAEQVEAVRAGMPERYQAMCDCGAGLGLRQRETFGLAADDIGFLTHRVHAARQVKLHLGTIPVFAPPKYGKERDVPLGDDVALALAAHIREHPPRPVTLPWKAPDGKPVTVTLLFTGPRGALYKSAFNARVWRPARRAAGIADGREAGMHALRHSYASFMLRGGIDPRRLSEWLGHHNPSVTFGYYAHLIPDDDEASLRQVNAALRARTALSTVASQNADMHGTGSDGQPGA